ncbi:MAG TPA: hypothetical protein VMH22_03095 [bacterium]|nr:hypothetical protein [bacterium]
MSRTEDTKFEGRRKKPLVRTFLLFAVALAGLSLMTCNALKTIQVTLDIKGQSTAYFTGFYETTTDGQSAIAGSPPKSYTFSARQQLDVVAAQIVYAGTGDLIAKLVSGGVTRDSGTINTVGTLALHWTP